MRNKMIENAKKTEFNVPVVLFLIIAYFIFFVGDFIGGNIAIKLTEMNSFFRTYRDFVSLASCCVSSLLLFLWVRFVEMRKINGLGFYAERLVKDTVIGTIAGFGSFALLVFAGKMLGVISYGGIDLGTKNILLVLLIIPFWFIQAGAEEVLTRGFVLPMVSAKTNRALGVIVSSILFVLFHVSNFGLNYLAILNIFIIGVLLALYTLATDNIWGSIAFHAFWNFTQGTFFGLSVSGGSTMNITLMNTSSSGIQLLSGGSFGIEASILNTILIMILIATFSLKCRKSGEK